jgi:hypothetical protein
MLFCAVHLGVESGGFLLPRSDSSLFGFQPAAI